MGRRRTDAHGRQRCEVRGRSGIGEEEERWLGVGVEEERWPGVRS
jgi:hypothetical protein